MPRTGRRPGDSGTRDAILDAARTAFAELGYDGATIRAIAARAEVDPALVYHFHDSKEALFTAAMQLPFRPSEVIPSLLHGDPDTLGERLLRFFLGVLDQPGISPFVALLRSASSNEQAATMLRQYLTGEVLGRIARSLGTSQPRLRATLVGSQMAGLAMIRHILRVEPLASADQDTVIACIAPTLQRYLTGDLGPPGASDPDDGPGPGTSHGDD